MKNWIKLTAILMFLVFPSICLAKSTRTTNETVYYVDPSNADQGVVGNGSTIKDLAAAIGTSTKATLVLPHSGSGITTAYTVSTALDLSSYQNIKFQIENGAQLELGSGVTLPSPSNVIAQPSQQIFYGSGTLLWTAGGVGEICPGWWGFSPLASALTNTTALRAAIASPIVDSYESYILMARQGINVGSVPVVKLLNGKYDLDDEIPFFGYTKIHANHAILNQTDASKSIFTSSSIYQNEFNGISFVGGVTQIYAQNGTNQEGVLFKVTNCEFQGSYGPAIQFLKAPPSGGERGIIEKSKFFYCAQVLDTHFDRTTIKDSWIETDSGFFANDTAQIVCGNLYISNTMILSSGDYNVGGNTNRWIDNYGNLTIEDCTFGNEGGGGMPPVYDFNDVLASGVTYPYIVQSQVIIKDSTIASGGAAKPDSGVVVLKTGLPSLLILENNNFAFDVPYIRTDLMTSGVTLTTYLEGISANEPLLSIKVKNNIGWACSLTSSAVDTNLLRPWLEYNETKTGTGGNTSGIHNLYLSELVLNGDFSAGTTNWTLDNSTLASVAGGQTGNCLEITGDGGGATNDAYQAHSFIAGKIYNISGWVKTGTSGNEAWVAQVSNPGVATMFSVSGTSSANWVQFFGRFVADSNSIRLTLRKNTGTAGTMLFDNVILY